MKLKDQVALVTGTSPNIGGGIVDGLAAEGAIIVAVDSRPENANDCAAYINKNGGKAIGLVCDVTDEAQVKATVDAALKEFGKIDILVNNAAFFNQKGVLNMPYAEWQAQTGVILDGSFLFTKYVATAMVERKTQGKIINIISTAGHQGQPGNVAYSTSKMGMKNFTNSVAMELAKYGIRVNALTPTATDSSESRERAAAWGREVPPLPPGASAGVHNFMRLVPMQRLPKPSDYGKAAAFLCSDDASMITGMDLRVDGGAVAKYWAWDPSQDPRV
ncbi:SDR family NAD(P)-dependent oxidoreductase [Phenylobacterium sp.]|uniref:SDR family NAD(P)-dependent oxidoreductase n=1 Tax=Phenylobacterium sp. TaxID=1871053 RepID=UPI0027349329|nr:SDR family NAD(P)-dependent oxidoreductase [Phenylobacterium sp.]MDP3660347.1 SDR family NAD(P)-dependent oxidoreductase [Phenylobacterium sp.]